MKTNLLLPLLMLFCISFLQAQKPSCGFDERHNKLMETNPEYKQEFHAMNERIREIIDNGLLQNNQLLPPVYTIPIVVHVLYKTEGGGVEVGNISDAQILSAIDNMNDVYGGLTAASPNVEIQFCMATQTPACGASTGINRIDLTAFADYAVNGITDANEADVKAQSRWPANQYMNIWLVTEIDNNEGGFGTQGYAYLPSLGVPEKDGIVMLYNTYGYDPGGANNYNLKDSTNTNETLIHEMGHALNLHHTFADGGDETTCASDAVADCATTGDFICDTEPHLNPNSVCPEGIVNGCTGAVYGDVLYNFMNYTTQYCIDRFSADQVDRIRATMLNNLFIEGGFLTTGRVSLDESEGCSMPTPVSTTAGYCSDETDDDKLAFNIGTANVEIGTINAITATPQFDSVYYNTTHIEHCELTIHANGASVPVFLDVDALDSGNPIHAKVFIDYNNDGDFDDMNPNEEALVIINNPATNGEITGNIVLPTRAAFPNLVINEPLKMRVIADFTGLTNNADAITPCVAAYGQMEDFNIMLTNALPVSLIKYEAEKVGSTAALDWSTGVEVNNRFFKIERSTGQVGFSHIASISSTALDNEGAEYEFIDTKPSSGINYYRLTQYDEDGRSQMLGIRSVKFQSRAFSIYPNPVRNNLLILELPDEQSEWKVEIYNVTGSIVKSVSISGQDANSKIDIDQLAPGSYFVKVQNGTDVQVKEFVKL